MKNLNWNELQWIFQFGLTFSSFSSTSLQVWRHTPVVRDYQGTRAGQDDQILTEVVKPHLNKHSKSICREDLFTWNSFAISQVSAFLMRMLANHRRLQISASSDYLSTKSYIRPKRFCYSLWSQLPAFRRPKWSRPSTYSESPRLTLMKGNVVSTS